MISIAYKGRKNFFYRAFFATQSYPIAFQNTLLKAGAKRTHLFRLSLKSGNCNFFVTFRRRQYDMIESRIRETSNWNVETFSLSP